MSQCEQIGLEFVAEGGRWADYLALARYHYRAARPATVHSVWRIVAADGAGSPRRPPGLETACVSGSLLWRAGGYPAVAAVAVVSYPALCSLGRDAATGGRYRTRPDRRPGLVLLNREVRTVSRVIVHPLYRGLGLATRLVGEVLARLDAPVVEAFARMGRYVPFFKHAGMAESAVPGRPTYYIADRRGASAGGPG